MKGLLTTLNAKYIHTNLALHSLFTAGKEIPGISLSLMEFSINNEDDLIFGELIRGEYDLLCFSCYIWNIERTLPLVGALKKANPSMKILLGGPEATHRAKALMEETPGVDLILAGEAEETFPRLLEALERQKKSNEENQTGALVGIPGLFYRTGEGVQFTEEPNPLKVSYLAFPYEEQELLTDKILYYESSRGCPYSCSYCLSALERGVRALPLDRVKEDLNRFLEKGVKQVKLVDRTFNFDRTRAKELFSYLMEKDRGITNFHFEICAELLDDATMDLLQEARPGLFQFEIGVQSTNQKTIEAVNRHGNFEQVAQSVKRLMTIGNIHLHLDLIAGLPFEDYNTFIRSFDQVYELRPHHLQLGFLKVLPGTPIAKQVEEFGYEYRAKPPYEILSNQFLSPSDLVHLKMVEKVLDLYYNRGGFETTLDFLIAERKEGPYSLYYDFATYFYEQGHQLRNHKKEALYRILWHYGKGLDKYKTGVAVEVEDHLTYDMNQTLNTEAVRKFMKEGWSFTNERTGSI